MWRSWMPATHDAAKALALDGAIEITQKGVVRDPEVKVAGPYRLRAANMTARAPKSPASECPKAQRRRAG